MPSLEFEAQKATARLWEGVLRAGGGQHALDSVSAYLCNRPLVAELLLQGCCDEALTFLCGELLLLGVRDRSFARALLKEGADLRLVSAAATQGSIEVKATALACLRGLLLESGDAASEHLQDTFCRFLSAYHELLVTEDLFIQLQALNLFGHLLLSPEFCSARTAYVSSVRCLKLQMSLLTHPVGSIMLGAFHIFKVFVANPYKTPAVQALLYRNRERLPRLLHGFHVFREGDDAYSADLAAVQVAVLELPAPPAPCAGHQAAGRGGCGAGERTAPEQPGARRRRRQKQEVMVLDNSLLKSTAEGVGYRRTPNMRDLSGDVARWGAVVRGSLSKDGLWLDAGIGLLPVRIRGVQVLQRREAVGDEEDPITMRQFLKISQSQPELFPRWAHTSSTAKDDLRPDMCTGLCSNTSPASPSTDASGSSISKGATLSPDPNQLSESALGLPTLLTSCRSRLTKAALADKKKVSFAEAGDEGLNSQGSRADPSSRLAA